MPNTFLFEEIGNSTRYILPAIIGAKNLWLPLIQRGEAGHVVADHTRNLILGFDEL